MVKSKGILYQIGDSLKLFSCKEECQKNIENYQNREKFLCNIFLNRDLYDIEMTEEEQKETISMNNNDLFNNNNIDIDNIPWIISKYVFENNQEHGYKLHKGDIFKLGKYILRVRELGIEYDKKHLFFENKNTQKYIKNKSISINNLSQMPLNQQGENYCSALNLNNIINVQRKDENRNENNENSHNNNAIENGSSYNNNNNIQIINNESDNNNNNENSNNNSNGNGSNNLNNNDNNFISIIKLQNNNENNENNDNNFIQNNKSINNSNNSGNNNSQSHNHYEIISNNGTNNNDNDNNNGNPFYINIINSSNNENNNNILDDSKNKINNNSLGFPTFHNNSIINSSINNSGKNISNFNNNSFKNIENDNENSKKNLNLNINNNNCQVIKSNFKALKSTASFKKKKLTEIIQKNILKNTISVTDKNNNKPICRICLSEEYEENNPLIHPCNCDGTMKYIHLQCLRLLIQSKIKKTETESCKVFTFKTLECEICKMVFPEKIRIKGSIFPIIDFEKPDKDYIILDGLIKEIPEEKSIFIVHFKNKKEIKIGRATDANIRLSDISVSRAHAIISQYNDSFYLHDTNSKFGTLISAGNKFCILYNKPFSVQKGNILFEFLMKRTICALLRCYQPSGVLYKTYNDFLDETFLYKNQYKDDELLIPEQTKSVSEYSNKIILKQNHLKSKSTKIVDIFDEDKKESNESNNNKKKEKNSIQSKEDYIKSSSSLSNNSNENNSNNNGGGNNNNQQNLLYSFKMNTENKNEENINSIGINKTQEVSNIYQKNGNMKSNSKIDITLDNNRNENSLLFNNVNNNYKDK